MEINEYLLKFICISKRMEETDLFADAAKLSKTEFRLIREILMEAENGRKIISSELARRLGITRSAVSQIVGKLESRGIVKRTAAPDDRKIAYIELSDHSLAVYEEQCRQANEIMEAVAAKLGKNKMDRLVAGYEEFSKALAEARKKVGNQRGCAADERHANEENI